MNTYNIIIYNIIYITYITNIYGCTLPKTYKLLNCDKHEKISK